MNDPTADLLESMVKKINELNGRVRDLENIAKTPYSEGTWTPAFVGATIAGTLTYTTQIGLYSRIGKIVVASYRLTVNVVSVAPTGALQVTGLPIQSSSLLVQGPANINSFSLIGIGGGAKVSLGMLVNPSSSIIQLVVNNSGGTGLANLTGAVANLVNGSDLITNFVYRIN